MKGAVMLIKCFCAGYYHSGFSHFSVHRLHSDLLDQQALTACRTRCNLQLGQLWWDAV